jgi:hypothetical protein
MVHFNHKMGYRTEPSQVGKNFAGQIVISNLKEFLADSLERFGEVDGVCGDDIDVGGEFCYRLVGLRGLGHGRLSRCYLLGSEDEGLFVRSEWSIRHK